MLNLLNCSATSICKGILQVVISTGVLNFFCTGIYFHIDTGTQLIPVFVKNEDQYFKKFDKINKPKKGKTRCIVSIPCGFDVYEGDVTVNYPLSRFAIEVIFAFY